MTYAAVSLCGSASSFARNGSRGVPGYQPKKLDIDKGPNVFVLRVAQAWLSPGDGCWGIVNGCSSVHGLA
jgi:hypothetical protein